ncbi:unnamed protein product, partial [Prorocentrum cordatum]
MPAQRRRRVRAARACQCARLRAFCTRGSDQRGTIGRRGRRRREEEEEEEEEEEQRQLQTCTDPSAARGSGPGPEWPLGRSSPSAACDATVQRPARSAPPAPPESQGHRRPLPRGATPAQGRPTRTRSPLLGLKLSRGGRSSRAGGLGFCAGAGSLERGMGVLDRLGTDRC